ncbi:MAG: SH3 domain-containing protein [Pyrinomonadaceae bacterium]
MKQCPRCNEVYSEQLQFCLNDGSSLIEFRNSDDGPETVARNTPIVINLDDAQTGQSSNQSQRSQTDQASSKKGFGLLLAGVAIGGVLVLVTIFAMSFMQKSDAVTRQGNISSGDPTIKNTNIAVSKTENTDVTKTDNEDTSTNAKKSGKSKPTEKEVSESDKENSSVESKTKLKRKGFNGRVIMMNAIIRSSPSMYAPEIYVVGYDESIKIGKSAGGNNPWFRVTTSNGSTGWMHGNTIEFVR